MVSGYTALKLSEQTRQEIMSAFPPQFPDIACDHVTIEFGVKEDHPLPADNPDIEIIGHAINKNGIEALVVSVNGETERPDGSAYHITLSYDGSKNAPAEYDVKKPEEKRKEKPFRPFHSNALIQVDGYDPVAVDINVQATPVFQASQSAAKQSAPSQQQTQPPQPPPP